MKKLLSIILTSVFICNILGYQLAFTFLQYQIQREIKMQIRKGLNDEELTVISAKEDNIQWIKADKEFRHNNKMYDIVRIKTIGHKIFYFCLEDKKEKELIANYNKIHNSGHKNKKLKRTQNIQLFCQEIFSILLLKPSDHVFSQFNYRLIDNHIIVPSPPPKSA